MMNTHGEQLVNFFGSASRAAMVVAPFLKEHALRRILVDLPDAVPLCLVTRWRPEEVARGVSDLSVFDFAIGRAHTRLLLHPTLHAKYFRCDDRCFVGSANVTATALGWKQPSNAELLLEPAGGTAALQAWQNTLQTECVPATSGLREEVQRLADLFPPSPVAPTWIRDPFAVLPARTQSSAVASAFPRTAWVPHTRQPGLLWRHYEGSWDKLTSTQRAAVRTDFQYLQLPPHLDKHTFFAHVGDALWASTAVAELDALLTAGPQRFGAIREWMADYLGRTGTNRDAQAATQTLYRWVLLFLSSRFVQVESAYSEVLAKSTENTPAA